ncbi:helix-turn-helix domain-containing protein [Methylorubrum extorquens]
MSEHIFQVLSAPTVDGLTAERLLGLGRAATYAAVRRGQIPSIRIGHQYRVSTAQLREMLGLSAARPTSE